MCYHIALTCRVEEELQLELKDEGSNEELGYLLVKLRIESGTTHIEDQKSSKMKHVCVL